MHLSNRYSEFSGARLDALSISERASGYSWFRMCTFARAMETATGCGKADVLAISANRSQEQPKVENAARMRTNVLLITVSLPMLSSDVDCSRGRGDPLVGESVARHPRDGGGQDLFDKVSCLAAFLLTALPVLKIPFVPVGIWKRVIRNTCYSVRIFSHPFTPKRISHFGYDFFDFFCASIAPVKHHFLNTVLS